MPYLLLIVMLTLCFSNPLASDTPAGLVVNADIHTMDPDRPRAEAMAWDEHGRILAVGGTEELSSRFAGIESVDLDGAAVLPGLIDAHVHLTGLGLARLQADLTGSASIDEVIGRLRAHAARLPDDAWLTGRGWDQNLWPEQEFPTAADLDAAFPERPVWLVRIDGHAGWANTAALERAEADLSGDWQPVGGRILRDTHGNPAGVLIDGAMELVTKTIPAPGEALLDRALDLALAETARFGLTSVHEAGTSLDELRRYLHRAATGRLPLRVYALADGEGALLDALCRDGPVTEAGGRVIARGVKYYADGALGSRGAALLADYADDPGNRGLLFHEFVELERRVERAMGCGLQVAVHAIGDAANRQVLDAIERVRPRHPDNPGRHRIEHVQIIDPDDFGRLSKLGVIASMQPTHATSDMGWAVARLGEDRLDGAYPWRSLKKAGARLAFGSDFPVEPVNPFLGIHAAVTRQTQDGNPPGGWLPDQRLTVFEAVQAFTLDAAHAGFAEDRVGSLKAGKLADFIVLDRNPFKIPAEELAGVRVRMTVLGGEVVHRRDGNGG